jgi:hypothetical protein
MPAYFLVPLTGWPEVSQRHYLVSCCHTMNHVVTAILNQRQKVVNLLECSVADPVLFYRLDPGFGSRIFLTTPKNKTLLPKA